MIQRAGGGKELEKMGRWCSVTIPIYWQLCDEHSPILYKIIFELYFGTLNLFFLTIKTLYFTVGFE